MTEANIPRTSDQQGQKVVKNDEERKEIINLPSGGTITKSNRLIQDLQNGKRDKRFRSPIRVQVNSQPDDTEIQIHVINPNLQSHVRRNKRDKDLRAPIRVAIISGAKNTEVFLHATKEGIQAKIVKGEPKVETGAKSNRVNETKSELLC